MAKILVSDSLAQEGLNILEDNGANEVVFKPDITPEDLVKEIGEYEALVIRSRTQVPEEVLEAGKKLKIVGRAGVGVDNVDIAAATERGIIVANAPEGNTMSTCEHAISLMMSLVRNIPEGDATMKAGKWDKKKLKGRELFGKTLGIIGLGKIGREVAQRMKAFGMVVWGADPFVSSETAEKIGVALKSVDEIIEGADVITIHTPKTPETNNLINMDALKKMKKTAFLINCARGGIVNEEDLPKALEAGEIAGAAIDVYSTEPLADDHPLRQAPHLVLTPHLGASTAEAQEKVALQVAEQVVNCCKGGEVTTALNAPALNADLLKQMKTTLNLSEKLGRFVVQMLDGRVTKLAVEISGSLLDFPTEPIRLSVMKGFLEHTTDKPVNFVNAEAKMKSLGIEVIETTSKSAKDYVSLQRVMATTEDGKTISVSGTVFEPNRPRVVSVNALRFEMEPKGNIIMLENDDVPGVVGAVTTAVGNANLNIGEISWGRDKQGGTAMTAICLDSEAPAEIVDQIKKLDNIRSARIVKL
ncbi:MAG: phosphoglycerate dehydrogenase [Candidatus Sumerlaeia bacterium]